VLVLAAAGAALRWLTSGTAVRPAERAARNRPDAPAPTGGMVFGSVIHPTVHSGFR